MTRRPGRATSRCARHVRVGHHLWSRPARRAGRGMGRHHVRARARSTRRCRREWEVVPVIKVGADLARRARDYLSTLHRLAPDAALVEVAAPNNRVELRYQSAERRSEVLTGGVPPWTWIGLVPLAPRSGRALRQLHQWPRDGPRRRCSLLRQHFRGPIYCDLHSLLLAVRAGRTAHAASAHRRRRAGAAARTCSR